MLIGEIIVIVLPVIVIAYVGVCAYIAGVLTVPSKSPVTFDKLKIGSDVEDVEFKAMDGAKLKGWLFKENSRKVIMFVHGAGNQNRANEVYGTPEIASYLLSLRYNVLLFDLRSTGESEKSRTSFGQYEKNDIIGAFAFLEAKGYAPSDIGIISNSLGAIATIMAADELKEAEGIVLDSPATEVKSIVSNIMVDEHSVPRFLHPGIYFVTKLLYKIDVDSVRPIDHVAVLKETPLLFLHGEKDTLITPSNSAELLTKVNKGKRVVFECAKHVETFKTNPEVYKKEIFEFFRDNLE